MPLTNFEIYLTLTLSASCVLANKINRKANSSANPLLIAISNRIRAIVTITGAKLYVPVVTQLTKDDKKLLQQLKTGFKPTIKSNKWRYEMSNQSKKNNLNYLIDPAFNKINKHLCCHLKTKSIGRLLQNIIHQLLRLKTIMC